MRNGAKLCAITHNLTHVWGRPCMQANEPCVHAKVLNGRPATTKHYYGSELGRKKITERDPNEGDRFLPKGFMMGGFWVAAKHAISHVQYGPEISLQGITTPISPESICMLYSSLFVSTSPPPGEWACRAPIARRAPPRCGAGTRRGSRCATPADCTPSYTG